MIAAIKRLLGRRRIRASFFLSCISYVSIALGFFSQFYIAKVVGAYGYGIVAIALAYPSLIFSLATPKSNSVLARYLVEYRSQNNLELVIPTCLLGYTVDLLAALVTIGLIFATGQLIPATGYDGQKVYQLMMIYSLSMPFLAVTNTSFAILNGYEQYSQLGWIQLIKRIFLLTAFLGFIQFMGSGSRSLIAAYAASNLLYGGLAVGMAGWTVLSRQSVSYQQLFFKAGSQALVRHILGSYGWNFLLVTVTGFSTQLPVIFLGSTQGPESAGFFRLGVLLANAAMFPKAALGKTLLPKLTEEMRAHTGRWLSQQFRRWTLKLGIPLGLSILLASWLLYPLIDYVYGPEYTRVFAGFYLLLSSAAGLSVFFWLEPYYFAYARYRALALINLSYLLVFCLLGSLPVPMSGFVWLCLADLLAKILLIGLSLLGLRTVFRHS